MHTVHLYNITANRAASLHEKVRSVSLKTGLSMEMVEDKTKSTILVLVTWKRLSSKPSLNLSTIVICCATPPPSMDDATPFDIEEGWQLIHTSTPKNYHNIPTSRLERTSRNEVYV